jgi:tetratricopeptide (TPR) repeat protein
MKKTIILIAVLLICSLTAVWSQTMTKQQALNEIARIERFNAQVDEMLRQAWEAGRTKTETVIDTPYGKVTVKFNLTGLPNGEMSGNELRLNTESYHNKTTEDMKATIAHELGHHMDRSGSRVLALGAGYMSTEDISEINADAFALRHSDKFYTIAKLKDNQLAGQAYIDAVINRAEQMEREEIENLARLRNIAGLPPQPQSSQLRRQVQNAISAMQYFDSAKAVRNTDRAKAIANYNEAIRLSPNYRDAYIERGILQSGFAAIADFTEALRINPDSADAYYWRGREYNQMKDYNKAIADLTEALRFRFPDSKMVYEKRAEAYMGKYDYDNAIADYSKNLSSGDSYILRAKAYLAKGDFDKAIADYTKAVTLFTERVQSSTDSYYTGALKRARQELRKAHETVSAPQRNSGKAALDRKNWDKAIADFTEIIQLFPYYADAYRYRAQAYIGKRKYKDARSDVNVALWLDPDYQEAKDLDAELKKNKH